MDRPSVARKLIATRQDWRERSVNGAMQARRCLPGCPESVHGASEDVRLGPPIPSLAVAPSVPSDGAQRWLLGRSISTSRRRKTPPATSRLCTSRWRSEMLLFDRLERAAEILQA